MLSGFFKYLGFWVCFGLLTAVWGSAAGQEAEDSDASDAENQAPVDDPCRDAQGRPESWLDRTHSYVNRQLCEPAVWFDGFFGGPRASEETPVGSFFRVRNSLIWDETEDFGHDLDLSANIVLPRLSERVRFLVSSDDAAEGGFNDNTSGGRDEDEQTRLGLRFLLSDKGKTQFDLDGTVKVNSGGLNPRMRGRGRHTRGLTDSTLARFTQSVFWELDEGFGLASRADLEWLPNSVSLVRLTGRAKYAEGSRGLEWRTGLIGFRQLNRKTAIRSEIGAFGRTERERGARAERNEVFVNFRFRRTFLRKWLFYELQPEYAWPVDTQTGERRSDLRFYLTLEIQFESATMRDGKVDHYRGR